MAQNIELSRGELIAWLNSMTRGNYTRIQQLGSGAAYCQLLDILYPGKLVLARINFKAKTEYEFICNLKLLQQSLHKSGIARQIDIEKLVKCKYQDNFELLQWFKTQFEIHGKKPSEASNTSNTRRQESRQPANAATNRSNAENSQGSFHKANVSFQQVLVELNRTPAVDDSASLRQDKSFYLLKLKDIDHLVETWNRNRPAQQLANAIKLIIGAQTDTVYNISQGQLTLADEDLI